MEREKYGKLDYTGFEEYLDWYSSGGIPGERGDTIYVFNFCNGYRAKVTNNWIKIETDEWSVEVVTNNDTTMSTKHKLSSEQVRILLDDVAGLPNE